MTGMENSSLSDVHPTVHEHIARASLAWWGDYQIPLRRGRTWQIGPMTLAVERLYGEWRVRIETGEDPWSSTVELGEDRSAIEDVGDAKSERIGVSGEHCTIRIEPQLAPRSVVSRPDVKFRVPSGESTKLFVSTPVWVRVLAKGPPDHELCDVPVFRPSDTWFGPDFRDGELCYASRTLCRTQLAEVPVRPHRCVTAVTIRNRGDDELPFERICLPVGSLAIYTGTNGRLWTPDVTLERKRDDETQFSVAKHAPSDAPDAVLLAKDRQSRHKHVVFQALGSLFS